VAQSPDQDADGVVGITVESNGAALPDSVRYYSVRVQRTIGALPSARLTVEDGDMPTGAWSVADAGSFAPGSEIVIKAGYGDKRATIFEGIVVKLGMRISGENFSRLVVDCQDKAVKMTVGRKNANYVDKTDSDIIRTLASNHGLSISVDSTSQQYGEIVQYYCTDWDFLVSRADVNGLLVIANDGKLSVKAPDVSQSAALKVAWGVDLMEFQGEVDARGQFAKVQAVAWDPKTQAIVEQTASPQALNKQGDLDSATLAAVLGVDTLTLQSATPIDAGALSTWAKAQQVRAGLARLRGRMKFQGSALAKVGGLIDISGVGARFNGSVFVGGLEHEIHDGQWITEASFGLAADWFAERPDVVAPSAAGWVPGVEGLQTGVVMKLNDDPLGEKRIQVRLPVLKNEVEGVWARLMQSYASNTFGAFYLPEVGDEVVVAYFNNDPSNPVILGGLYSSKRPPPYELTAENNIKALVTRSKTKIEINDEDKVVTIQTPANNKIVINDKEKSILLSDETKNSVKLDESGITLDSPKDIVLTAKGSISATATKSISLTAGLDLSGKGKNVTLQADIALSAKGASTELNGTGTTIIKGAPVMIN
jgi:Rhs element Vgr protein